VAKLIEEIIISSLILAGLYILLSVGFSLIAGVARILNFAHGSLYLISAYLIYSLLPLGHGIAIIITLIATPLLGLLIYRLFIGPLREKGARAVLVTFALALFFQEVLKLIFGPQIISIPNIVSGYSTIIGVNVTNQKILSFVVALISVSLLWLFIRRTKRGKAIRAVTQNMDVARLVGINIRAVLMTSMGLSVLLAGIAAVLFAPTWSVSPSDWTILFRAFPVIVLGGIGSIKGSAVASFLLAFTETTVIFTLGGGNLVKIVSFFLMLMVIFIRPTGLFGKSTGDQQWQR
jgi:branched-chain amino acid transport system permease protein